MTDTSKFSSYVRSYGIEKQSEETLKKFIVECVLNDGHLSKTNAEEISAEQIKKAGLDKYYIPPSNDNIIMSEQPVSLNDSGLSTPTGHDAMKKS